MNTLWHICGRGVEKRDVFVEDPDRVRFIHNLYAFNDADVVSHDFQPGRTTKKRKLLVRVHAYCLMNNHYHLLLSGVVEEGVSKFMQKVNMGYTKYFNEKYERSGGLWQGKYKKILIKRDAHFNYIPYYIHLNPLDYTHPEWRQGTIKNVTRVLNSLQKYRWSSYLDYMQIKNFPSVLDMNLLSDVLGTPKHQRQEIRGIISNRAVASQSNSIEPKY